MENVFEEVLGTNTETTIDSADSTEAESTLGPEFDLDFNESESAENDSEINSEEDTNEEEDNTVIDTPTNEAFKQMRTQNKEYSEKINALDAIAKSAGLSGIDDLITQARDAQIKKQAQEQGIPEEVAKRLAAMDEFMENYRQDQEEAAYKAKEQTLVNNLHSFIDENNLSKTAVDNMSASLAKDGFTTEDLMNYPKSALNRILSSYINLDVQKNLERKNAISKELPINHSSTVDTQAINKQLDKLAKQFAGKL